MVVRVLPGQQRGARGAALRGGRDVVGERGAVPRQQPRRLGHHVPLELAAGLVVELDQDDVRPVGGRGVAALRPAGQGRRAAGGHQTGGREQSGATECEPVVRGEGHQVKRCDPSERQARSASASESETSASAAEISSRSPPASPIASTSTPALRALGGEGVQLRRRARDHEPTRSLAEQTRFARPAAQLDQGVEVGAHADPATDRALGQGAGEAAVADVVGGRSGARTAPPRAPARSRRGPPRSRRPAARFRGRRAASPARSRPARARTAPPAQSRRPR